jgi:hypothetical protein
MSTRKPANPAGGGIRQLRPGRARSTLYPTVYPGAQETPISRAFLDRNPITGIAGCYARAASGHVVAPPSSVMNSRHLMGAYPKAKDRRIIAGQGRASQQKRAAHVRSGSNSALSAMSRSMSGLPGSGHGWAIEQRCRPTRPTGLGVLEISEAGSAWPSTAAPDRGLGRPVAGRGRARIRGLQDPTVVDLDQGIAH